MKLYVGHLYHTMTKADLGALFYPPRLGSEIQDHQPNHFSILA